MPSHHKGLAAPQNNFLDTIVSKFDGTHSNFLLCNARGNKVCPIVYCSDDFCQLTGYTKSEIMGKPCACTFLYGEQTSSHAKQLIQVAVNFRTEVRTEILLYRKDGTPYRCWFELVPIKNGKGQEVLFLVLQKNIDAVELQDQIQMGTINPIQEVYEHGHLHEQGEGENEQLGSDRNGLGMQSRSGNGDRRNDIFTIGPATCKPNSGDSSTLLSRQGSTRSKSAAPKCKVFPTLSNIFTAAKKSKLNSTFQTFSPTETSIVVPEYKTDDLRHRRFIVRHYGILRIAWDWLCLLCTFYIAIMVPYYAAFLEHQDDDRDFIWTDVVVEMLFIIDITLNFLTTYINRSGKVVYDLRLIAWNYLKGWFILDLSAAIPFELLHALNITTGVRINLLKLARMLRLARLLQKIDRYSQYSAVVLALLMSMFTLVAHWFACIWYVIGKEEIALHPTNWTVGWLHDLATRTQQPFGPNRTAGPNLPSAYITSLYFSTSSLTSVGFGNVSANTIAEKVFSVCAMLIGALMHAAVFGNVTAIIQRMYARRAAYQTKANDLKEFARIHRLPKGLKQRMYEFFQINWSVNHGLDTALAMNDFPEELRCDISLHLYREVLALPMFSDAPYGCIKRIAYESVRYRFCTPNELLVNDSDQLGYLYYIASGSVEILRNSQVVCILGKGDIFGTDFRMLNRTRMLQRLQSLPSECENWVRQNLSLFKSLCDARTMTYCDIYLVDVEKLLFILIRYPEFTRTFCNRLQVDLSYNLQYIEPEPNAVESDPVIEIEDEVEVDFPLTPIMEKEELNESGLEVSNSVNFRANALDARRSSDAEANTPSTTRLVRSCSCRVSFSQKVRANDKQLQNIHDSIKDIRENITLLNSKMDQLLEVFQNGSQNGRLTDEARQFSFIDEDGAE